ncbi:MAG: putative baseplate assembly protein [Lysobacter sp.]|nr:putative baseplate assembly protein [Lysobacter sp.]
MSCHTCGCDAARCDCCTGIVTMTPASIENRPGLPALHYRVGTHGRFLASMKARLPMIEVVAPGKDNQTLESFRPLQALTTRDPADPAIAILDAWATVADALTFYQERIANEGYVRTATERRSLVELSRLVGYAPRAGVSSSVFLSYTLDDNQADAVEIAIGTRSQSIPGPGQLPQSFETSEVLLARREWNDLQVRRKRPQRIDSSTIANMPMFYAAGTDTGVQPGDLLLFRFGTTAANTVSWARKATKIAADFSADRTAISLQPLPWLVLAALPLLQALTVDLIPAAARDTGAARALATARSLLDSVRLGLYPPAMTWATIIDDSAGVEDPEAMTLIQDFGAAIETMSNGPAAPAPVSSTPDIFASALLKPPLLQAANTQQLRRDLGTAFSAGADLQPQLLLGFAPRLKDSYYTAWRGATPPALPSPLEGVYALRDGELLFGATAGPEPAFDDGELLPPAEWGEWRYANDETETNAFLAKADALLAAGDLVLVQQPIERSSNRPQYGRQVLRVDEVFTGPRGAYGISADATRIEFAGAPWREVEGSQVRYSIDGLRKTRVYPQKQRLQLVEMPMEDMVFGQEIELGPLHASLTSGRWVIFEGERSDIDGVAGVRVSELLMVSGLVHGYDDTLPGDRPHTTLRLATATAYRYKRDTLRIHGNVVPASHGETRQEVMGNGDGAQALQHFALRQPPLTWRPAPTAAGATSTLKVLVNDVEWREADSLAGLGADARAFVTRTGDDGITTVTFGNGIDGRRLPTGFENVRAEYRSGIGKGGNVDARQISLLVTRPLGVKDVINPLRASGGADRETIGLIRENAPRSLIALDRLVSTSDYADFTRMYAGIAKAEAIRLSDGMRELVHITIAGVEDMPIDPESDLLRNLLASLRTLGDPGLVVQVAMRELVTLVLQAKIKLADGYRWEPVATAVRARLLDRFGFDQRPLARPALLCDIVAAIQSVRGVAWVDVDNFGGVPETFLDKNQNGKRVLATQDFITATVAQITGSQYGDSGFKPVRGPAQRVEAGGAELEGNGLEGGTIRPARLAMFSPAVADTLILNQIV